MMTPVPQCRILIAVEGLLAFGVVVGGFWVYVVCRVPCGGFVLCALWRLCVVWCVALYG